MNPLLDYFWPVLLIGVVAGIVAGTVQWRRKLVGAKRAGMIGSAAILAIAAYLVWSGPMGAADRFITAVEQPIRQMLVNYEMEQVSAELRRDPLRRQIVYHGPADEFQRTELVFMAEAWPGVASATWNLKVRAIPIVIEGAVVAIVGLLIGLLIAYLIELRRRSNADWSW